MLRSIPTGLCLWDEASSKEAGDYRPLGNSLSLGSTTQGQKSISRPVKGKCVKRRLPRARGKLEGKADGLECGVFRIFHDGLHSFPTDLTLDTCVVSTCSAQRAA